MFTAPGLSVRNAFRLCSSRWRTRLLGYRCGVVLGHPSYYPRFGFVPASRLGPRYEHPVPDAPWRSTMNTQSCLNYK